MLTDRACTEIAETLLASYIERGYFSRENLPFAAQLVKKLAEADDFAQQDRAPFRRHRASAVMSPDHIAGLASSVKHRRINVGVLSTGERLAVLLVLNRTDELKRGGDTVLEAIERVQSGGWPVEWLIAAQKTVRDEQ